MTTTLSGMLPKNVVGAALAGIVLFALPAAAEDNENQKDLKGSVEMLYRNVSVDGSTDKYNEDFDGLESGMRLGSLSLDWTSMDSKVLDYARLDVTGLGGDPYERSWFKLGRKDHFDLTINNWKQDYIYNLFGLTRDEDGHTWDSKRRMTDLTLKVYPMEKVRLLFQFQQGARTGTSLFMKDIERKLFRLETPLDYSTNRYTVGADFEVGPVDVVFRQTLRRYRNQFVNSTEGDLGIESGPTALSTYDWNQLDTSGTDWTTLKVHTALAERVQLTVAVMGTLLGDEKLTSRVDLEALGIDFNGAEFGGTCAASATPCSTDATCAAITPGDVCVPNAGTSRADLKGDTTLVDADLSIRLLDPLDLHLQYRSLDRDLDGTLFRDLNGDGVDDDEDGDGTPGTRIQNNYSIDTLTALLEYRPIPEVGVRGGYRTIERDLMRTGYNDVRDTPFQSNDDDTLILGVWVRPVDWFTLKADYEDGDVSQPFVAVEASERKHTRVRASFVPQEDMKLDLSYLDYKANNFAPDLRGFLSNWNTRFDGSTWSASFWHRANENIDYLLRYAKQNADNNVGIIFDTAVFAGTEAGFSIFDNDNKDYLAQVNFRWGGPWNGFVRYWAAESDGNNVVLGNVSGVVNDQVIDQKFKRAEAGLTYTYASGIWVGGSLMDFRYDDANNVLGYDGQIFTVRAGMTF